MRNLTLANKIIFKDKMVEHTYGEEKERRAGISEGIPVEQCLVRVDSISTVDGKTTIRTSRTDTLSQKLWTAEKSFVKERLIKGPNLLINKDSVAPNALGICILIRDMQGLVILTQRGANHLIGAGLAQCSVSTTLWDSDIAEGNEVWNAVARRLSGNKVHGEKMYSTMQDLGVIAVTPLEIVFSEKKMQPVMLVDVLVQNAVELNNKLQKDDSDYTMLVSLHDLDKVVKRTNMSEANKYFIENIVLEGGL